jgi:hypothetical protein
MDAQIKSNNLQNKNPRAGFVKEDDISISGAGDTPRRGMIIRKNG